MKVTLKSFNDFKKTLISSSPAVKNTNSVPQFNKEQPATVDAQKLNGALRAYSVSKTNINQPETITSRDLYNLLNAQVMNITEKDVKTMFDGIKRILEAKGVKAEDSEIKYTMKLLTQYANLNAFKEVDKLLPKKCFEKYFTSEGCGLSEFMYILDEKKHTFGENTNYFDTNRQYVFADDFSLNQYNERSYKCIKYYDPEVVFLTGFDEGINYFNHTADYSLFIENTAKIIEDVKQKQGRSDFKNTLINLLNERGKRNAAKHGLQIDKFLNIDNGEDADFNDILKNLNFNILSEKEIDALISSTAEFIEESTTFLGFKKNILKSALTKWFYNQLQIYSPKRINEGMKSAFNNLQRSENWNIVKEDLSLVIPGRQKSYTYMTRQFAQANGISPKQVMTPGQYYEKTHTYNEPGWDSFNSEENLGTALIVDDLSASGTSIVSVCLGDIEKENPESKCYYVPLACTQRAIQKINKAIEDRGYENKSKLIVTDIIQEDTDYSPAKYTRKEAAMLETLFDTTPHSIGRKGYSRSNTAVIFPVMTPDNNNSLVTLFADRILLNPSASKSVCDKYARETIKQKVAEKMKLQEI